MERNMGEKKQERLLRRHRLFWNHIGWLVKLLVRLRHPDFRAEPAPELEGPYLVLPNHANGYDQFFVGLSFLRRHMYFVVSEHAFRRRLVGAAMQAVFGPISRTKGGADASAVRGILRALRRGASVCLFPEGNRSWDGRSQHLHPATGKLIKLAKVPIMTYRITGGYPADPRWAHSIRRGPIRGAVVGVYSSEELAALSPEEITALVERDLRVDERENPHPYRGTKPAEGLEEALFLCPGCGGVGTLRSHDRSFACSCGLRAEYTDMGRLEGDVPFSTVPDWEDWQLSRVKELTAEPELHWEDGDGELRELEAGHSIRVLSRGPMILTREGIRVGDTLLPLEGMLDPSLCHFGNSETMMLTSRGRSYELCFPRPKGVQPPSIRKYQLMLEALLSGAAEGKEARGA